MLLCLFAFDRDFLPHGIALREVQCISDRYLVSPYIMAVICIATIQSVPNYLVYSLDTLSKIML